MCSTSKSSLRHNQVVFSEQSALPDQEGDDRRISAVYHGPYRPEATSTTVVIKIYTACGQLAIDDCSKQAVSCHVCFNFSRLNRHCTLPIALHDNPPSVIFAILMFKHTHLKFSASGRSKQASKRTYKHVCNEVMLVWSSLKLTPPTGSNSKFREKNPPR